MNTQHQAVWHQLFFVITVILISLVGQSAAFGDEVVNDSQMIAGVTTTTADPFTGAFNYSIPLEVPTGRQGIQPNLALAYRSTNGNGLLGVGWELELGSIERNTRFGVKYDSNDYLLRTSNGSTELVIVGNGEYRSKVEGAFSRFRMLTGGDGGIYWEVTEKSGVKYLYGQTRASRQDNPDNTSQVFKWCLDRIEDPDGNYLTITYTKDQGQIYADRIDYTGNSAQMPDKYVAFFRESRGDAPDMYTVNFKVKTAYRLKAIEIFASQNRVAKYEMIYDADSSIEGNQYSPDTGRSLLTMVNLYGSEGIKQLPIIRADWQKGASSFPPSYNWVSPFNYGKSYTSQLGDFNGDGKSDIYIFSSGAGSHAVWLNNGDGTFPTAYKWESPLGFGKSYTSQLGDFNGDGKADIYIFSSGAGSHAVWLNNGDGTFPATYNWESPLGFGKGYTSQLGDFNGDGKADIYIFSSGIGSHAVWLNKGDGTFPATYDWVSAFKYGKGYASRLGDFNGDGKSDIYIFSSGAGSHAVWLNSGNGTFPATYKWTSPLGFGTGYSSQLGDFNGDGKTDIYIFRSSDGSHAVWL